MFLPPDVRLICATTFFSSLMGVIRTNYHSRRMMLGVVSPRRIGVRMKKNLPSRCRINAIITSLILRHSAYSAYVVAIGSNLSAVISC